MPMGPMCITENCNKRVLRKGEYCPECLGLQMQESLKKDLVTAQRLASIKSDIDTEAFVRKMEENTTSVAQQYPKYYKSVEHLDVIDVYQVHKLFNIQDPSGAIQHASKKLLLSGARTGGKSQFKDIKEARDTLNRWLEMNETLDE